MSKKDRAGLILEAADELFGERGYDAVSVRDVAQHAGVNKALVFYYFRSKEALFEQVLQRYYTAHREALAEAFGTEGPLRDRFHAVLDGYVDFIKDNRRYPLLVQRLVGGDASNHALIRRNQAMLLEWTESALTDLAPESGPLAARHFYLTFSGAVVTYFTHAPLLEDLWGSDPSAPEAIEERRAHLHWLVDLLVDGLRRDA